MNNKYYLLISLFAVVFNSNQLFAKTTLITNINGYTLNGDILEKFTAIKFTNDKVDALYQDDHAIKVAKDTLVIDGHGQTMLPGLIDAHGHVLSYGLRLTQVDLVNSTSEVAAVEKTQAYALDNPNNTWIKGGGWNQVQWPSNQYPSAKSLDKVFPNTPVWLARVDCHAG